VVVSFDRVNHDRLRNIQGILFRRGFQVRLLARNPEPSSITYDPIPYTSEQGIYLGLAGN
jgi:hypothetical protein